MTKQERYEQIVKSYKPNYDIVFYARSAYLSRYTLSVDTAGGYWTAGWFKTKAEAVKYRKEKYPSLSFEIYDGWKSIAKPILDDMKFIMSYLKFRKNQP
jgi:hypothetical protein